MGDGGVSFGFLHLIAAGGREERFTFTLVGSACDECRRLIAWTPGALVPLVFDGGECACLLDALVAYAGRHGMAMDGRAPGGD